MNEVLLFARIQDEVGQKSLEADLAGKSIKESKRWVEDNYEVSSLTRTMVAVNEEFAKDDDVIDEGDTVAFIPPVSGG
ncbi:molybdopterin converting factor subunit 1 [Natribacillus halophilus]|uniref:Molybdopterin synthase sulfur carrier subunit n=1 Tax=Natribacillus halophilus TaxID=549003 RepID=A0A1G8MYZ5_9BACI|nr:molybdopterin converting factor subunit 1 [Natribacillus halophilus]SDI73065.1 molybdopterin synthase sulfur carrier subunit [Natribacillus halophilus]